MYVVGYVVKNNETIDDSFFSLSQFGPYLQEIECGDLKKSGDSICRWVIYCYAAFLQSASVMCCSCFISHDYIIHCIICRTLIWGVYYRRIVANLFVKNC